MSAHIPPVSRLSNTVTRVLGCNPGPMTLQGTNTYLVGSGARRVLIDAGEPSNGEYLEHLSSTVASEGTSVSDLVITHWHHDHVGGVPGVLTKLASIASETTKNITVRKFPRPEVPDSNAGWPVNHTLTQIKDGDRLSVDGATLRLIHTPGHTTDHVVLYLEEEQTLFSSDCILGEGTAVFEDLFTYMQSLEKILKLNPKRIYPGHGPVIENPVEKIEYYIKHRNQRESQILSELKDAVEPQTPMDLVKKIYRETPEHLHKAAAVNVGHHLEKLRKEGKAAQDQDTEKWSAI